jgi:hypothetical protein
MRRVQHLAILGFAGVILIGLTTGCTSTTNQDTLAANMLNVQMAISDPMVTSSGVIQGRIGFKVTLFEDLSYSEQRIAVDQADDFSCDGASLVHDGSGQYTFVGSLPSSEVQGDQTCSYTHNGKTTQFTFATPTRPAVLAPLTNAGVSMAENLTVQFTPSATAQTVIGIDAKPVMTLSQSIGEAIIPAAVWHQFLADNTFTLSVSQTSLLTPNSDFNDLEIEYTSLNSIPLTLSTTG